MLEQNELPPQGGACMPGLLRGGNTSLPFDLLIDCLIVAISLARTEMRLGAENIKEGTEPFVGACVDGATGLLGLLVLS